MNKSERDELRRKALAATPGEWEVDGPPLDSGGTYGINAIPDGCAVVWWGSNQDEGIRREEDAAYIAAANPQVVLSLLDDLDLAEAMIREMGKK